MKIAIVGTGISAMVVASKLHQTHDITVYEANNRIGGHVNTVDVHVGEKNYAIDTGFIVFNQRTYPKFVKLLSKLGVETLPTSMSFSSRCELTGIEYSSSSINSIFAQRRNVVNLRFLNMLADIFRFNRDAAKLINDHSQDSENHPKQSYSESLSLGDWLYENHYGDYFVQQYILPMGAAIWSTEPRKVLSFPAMFFVRFYSNHGLLTVNDQPQWSVIRGGSGVYLKELARDFHDKIRLEDRMVSIVRTATGVVTKTSSGTEEQYDHVFLGCHSDEALAILTDATSLERSVLRAIPYNKNIAVLHTDTSMLPTNKRTIAAWNALRTRHDPENLVVTYNMNKLQNIKSDTTFCVSLNSNGVVNENKIIDQFEYSHPLFTDTAIDAQSFRSNINGKRRTWFCGAYWGNGFHEDGVVSAENALTEFEEHLKYVQSAVYRVDKS